MWNFEGTDLYFPFSNRAGNYRKWRLNDKNSWLCRASKIFATSLAADPSTEGRSDTRLLKYSTYVALPILTLNTFNVQMWADLTDFHDLF